jgi:hypothetical protein
MTRLPPATRRLSWALALGLVAPAIPVTLVPAAPVSAAQPDGPNAVDSGAFPPPPASGGLAAPFSRGDAPVYVPPAPRDLTPAPGTVAPSAPGRSGSTIPSPGYNNYKEIPVFVPYSARDQVDPKDKTKGENLLESYFAPKYPTNPGPLHPTHGPSWAPGGDVDTGMRVGRPYYWSNHSYPSYGAGPVGSVTTAGFGYGPGSTPWVTQTGCACNRGGAVAFHGGGQVYGGGHVYGGAAPIYSGAGIGGASCGCGGGGVTGYGIGMYGVGQYGVGQYGMGGIAPGTYAGGFASDPYTYHFGPGFHRNSDHAHYRFPYYSYRRPWYHPGHASYNRDTNMPW